MKYDFQLLFLLVGIGLFTKKLTWKGWVTLSAVIISWITYNWIKNSGY